MKRKRMAFAAATLCILCGCRCGPVVEEVKTQIEKEEVKIAMESSIPPGECFVCGNQDSMMPYYARRDSVGVIHWKNFAVFDTEVRAYDDEGHELFDLEQSSHRFSSFGAGCGNISVSPQPNRGISDVRIGLGEKDVVDMELLSKKLCQGCLDRVAEFYEDSINFGSTENAAATGYCLVDFTDRQLYLKTSTTKYSSRFSQTQQRAALLVVSPNSLEPSSDSLYSPDL